MADTRKRFWRAKAIIEIRQTPAFMRLAQHLVHLGMWGAYNHNIYPAPKVSLL
jgi:hypothetical protein